MVKKEILEKKDLTQFGNDGQFRFAKALIEDRALFLQAYPILDAKKFSNAGLKKIIQLCIDYYNDKGLFPTYKDLEFLIKYDLETSEENEMYRETFSKLKDPSLYDGMQVTKENCLKFLKQLKVAELLKRAETANNKGYDIKVMENLIDGMKSLETGNTQRSSNLEEIMEVVLSRSISTKVPTGIPELDDKMQGGLPMGKIGLIIAGTGVGKSTLASIVCCNAALYGFKVLHIFFEDDKTDIGAKYYAHLTGMYASAFSDKGEKNALKETIWNSHPNAKKALRENIRLLRLPNGRLTIEEVCNEIRKEMTTGYVPDMVFIDYLSCIQSSSNKVIATEHEHETFERLAKKLESFASENNIAIWEAQQTNRNGMKEATANDRIANIQGSFRITQPASAILYLSRVGCEENRANLYLDKCRNGELGEWANIYMNNGTCQIDLSQAMPTNDINLVYDDGDYKAKIN